MDKHFLVLVSLDTDVNSELLGTILDVEGLDVTNKEHVQAVKNYLTEINTDSDLGLKSLSVISVTPEQLGLTIEILKDHLN